MSWTKLNIHEQTPWDNKALFSVSTPVDWFLADGEDFIKYFLSVSPWEILFSDSDLQILTSLSFLGHNFKLSSAISFLMSFDDVLNSQMFCFLLQLPWVLFTISWLELECVVQKHFEGWSLPLTLQFLFIEHVFTSWSGVVFLFNGAKQPKSGRISCDVSSAWSVLTSDTQLDPLSKGILSLSSSKDELSDFFPSKQYKYLLRARPDLFHRFNREALRLTL